MPNPIGWTNPTAGLSNCCRWQTRETKLAKTVADEQALFGLYSLGVVTNRDEWVYDFDPEQLGSKVRAFISEYEERRALYGGQQSVDDNVLGTSIKWTRDLKRQLRLDAPNVYDRNRVRQTLYRPFTNKAPVLQSASERDAISNASSIFA